MVWLVLGRALAAPGEVIDSGWQVLASSAPKDGWVVQVTALPRFPEQEISATCEVLLPSRELFCEGADAAVVETVSQAVARWSVAPHGRGELNAAVRLRIAPDEGGSTGHVAPKALRERLLGNTSAKPAADGVVARRRQAPVVDYGEMAELGYTFPIESAVEFAINEKGRPTQLLLYEVPDLLYKPVVSAGWAWRFTVAEGVEDPDYLLMLTFAQ